MSKTQSCVLLWMALRLRQICKMQVSKNLQRRQTERKDVSATHQTYKHNLKFASRALSPL